MFEADIADLDPAATLVAAVQARAVADRAEVRLLEAAAHWADLHGEPERLLDGRSLPGMERLIEMGGAGTPAVAEFCPAELGAELGMSSWSAQRLIGAALDLRHRLPQLWARIRAGQVRPWIGRKTADATRQLSAEVAALVDAEVARYADSLSWGRLADLIEATAMAAEPERAEKAALEAQTSQGVWVGPSGECGTKTIYIRTESPNAVWFDASIDRVADALELFGDTASKDIRRARAVGILAQPQQALNLFERTKAAAAGQPAPEPVHSRVDARAPATLYVHVSHDAFTRDTPRVARFEGEGPVTIEQAKRWLGHCAVTVKPVIDLADHAPVDVYEVPDRLREAVYLRNPVDVFPYATNTSRHRQIDHTIPYRPPDDGGPPGQTGMHNLGPMTGFHHRIKTHGRWHVRQPFPGVFVWRSPHGRIYTVNTTGTHQAIQAAWASRLRAPVTERCPPGAAHPRCVGGRPGRAAVSCRRAS